MRRIFLFISLFSSFLFLTACTPMYQTDYTYHPPRSQMGKLCVMQCQQGQSMCKEMCQMRKENCLMRAKQDALEEYRTYSNEQRRQHLPVNRTVSSFDRGTFTCNDSCDCTSSYQSCYQGCGGMIEEHKVCVAFCDKEKQ